MGVIIKYQIEFPDAGFKVSNDLLKGDFIIDADIKATMLRGTAGAAFEITLYDLPEDEVQKIVKAREGGKKPSLKILLGYFDGPFELVMEGIYTDVRCEVKDDKLQTSVNGVECGTYALDNTPVEFSHQGQVNNADLPGLLFQSAKLPTDQISKVPLIDGGIERTMNNPVFRSKKLMLSIGDFMRRTNADLVVVDKQARFGNPIQDNSRGPLKLDPDVNLARFEPFSTDVPEDTSLTLPKPPDPEKIEGFKFVITGDPKLRPGQRLAPKPGVFKISGNPEFRVREVTHRFSLTGGYVCEGIALKAGASDRLSRQADAIAEHSASTFVQNLIRMNRGENQQRPVVEVASVQSYAAGTHQGTLYFGQKYEQSETQPSIHIEVEKKDEQVFANKPMVSPFAWRKCGLIVPVYPGMKAVLNHNLALPEDALVTGFLWSENPSFEPPKNKEGDWWLCLPIDFDSSSPPADDTKAVNDLIANDGNRVIELKGLKIRVGADLLGKVGKRPDLLSAENQFVIEHSKAKISIGQDGSIEIVSNSAAGTGKISIAASGDIEMNSGAVKLKVGQSGVEIS